MKTNKGDLCAAVNCNKMKKKKKKKKDEKDLSVYKSPCFSTVNSL